MKIFVSHSGKDKEIAEKIDAILTRLEIERWIDLRRIKGGTSVRSEIDNGFLNSTHFFTSLVKGC
jgi:TIR domain-containing protein